MLMVIFGAGASYDSAQAFRVGASARGPSQNFPGGVATPIRVGPSEIWRPPLAKDLFQDPHLAFSEIVRKYPKLSHVLPYLREPSGRKSVEEVLEDLRSEGRDEPESQREFMSIRFYLCELFTKLSEEWGQLTDGVTNYAPLVKQVLRSSDSKWPISLVSFNYDLLLENALSSFDYKRRLIEEHFESHPILKLFKLHGSVAWARTVNYPQDVRLVPAGLIASAPEYKVTDTFVLGNATHPYDMHTFGRPIVPALAIPVQTKTHDYFECPASHLSYLEGLLPHISKILIVGWQAREAHFLNLLRSRLRKLRALMVVGANASDATTVMNYFVKELRFDVPKKMIGQGGFTDFIVNREGEQFFSEQIE